MLRYILQIMLFPERLVFLYRFNYIQKRSEMVDYRFTNRSYLIILVCFFDQVVFQHFLDPWGNFWRGYVKIIFDVG